jgi:hypothetical protein
MNLCFQLNTVHDVSNLVILLGYLIYLIYLKLLSVQFFSLSVLRKKFDFVVQVSLICCNISCLN